MLGDQRLKLAVRPEAVRVNVVLGRFDRLRRLAFEFRQPTNEAQDLRCVLRRRLADPNVAHWPVKFG